MPDGFREKISKKKWTEYLQKQNLGHRLLIGLVVWLCLGIFLHFREVRLELLELGSTAKNYVVAQVDFEFPDQDSTVILRQEALKDIGSIYEINEHEIKEKRFNFENYLVHHHNWRETASDSTFDEMNKAADKVEDLLFLVRFTNQRTFKKMKELKLDTEDYYVLPHFKDKSQMLPPDFWHDISQKMLKNKFPSSTVHFIVSYFQKFQWSMDMDVHSQKKLRDIVGESVPEKITKIRSGSRIVDQGEKVTGKHVAMLQAMKIALAESRNLWQPLTIIGSLLFSFLIVLLGWYYFRFSHKEILKSVNKLSLYATIVILTLIFAKMTEFLLLRNTSNILEIVRYPLFIPFAALLLTVLMGPQIALFSTCFLSVLLGVSLAVDHSKFLVINLVLGVIAIIFSRGLRKRKEVFGVCGKVWLTGIPILFSYNFLANTFWSYALITDFVSTFCFMIITSILVIGFLPILESIFHVMTDITLMEYMDPNNELLRRLSLEAPGTYQHSLVVGTIAEAAAQAIGANGLFCRVSTQYHDIGKLFNPHYFTENQMGGFNIHQLLTPIESSQVIIAHVTEGEALAKKYALPQSFIDIIREHHGTTLVYYFYCKQVEQMGGDVDAVKEDQFRYPGPKPRSKESAIIMIADTIEAASRSLEEVTEESLTEMVDRLVSDKTDEGQFDDCQLTFEELGQVKRAIVKTLAVTRHLRVKYPDRKNKEALT